MKKNSVTSENMANEKNMSTTDVISKQMAKEKKMLINDVTSEKMAKEIKKESMPVLFTKMNQSIEYYDKTNTLPQFVNEDFFDKAISTLVNFRNKLYTDDYIIDLKVKNE